MTQVSAMPLKVATVICQQFASTQRAALDVTAVFKLAGQVSFKILTRQHYFVTVYLYFVMCKSCIQITSITREIVHLSLK